MEELNEESEKVNQIMPCSVILRDHQLASVQKMIDIEEGKTPEFRIRIAVLGNRIGSGKSYTILELIKHRPHSNNWDINNMLITNRYFDIHVKANFKYAPVTVIVVPHMLFNQWINYVKEYNLRYLTVKNPGPNENELELMCNGQVDCVILKNNQYKEFFNKTQYIFVSRLVLDESWYLKFVHLRTGRKIVKSLFIWCIQAYESGSKRMLPFRIKPTPGVPYEKLIVKCNDDFVKKSLSLPNYVERKLEYMPSTLEYILRNNITDKVIRCIEADAIQSACKMLNIKYDKTINFVHAYVEKLKIKLENELHQAKKLRVKSKLDSINEKLKLMTCVICYEVTQYHVLSKCCKNIYCTDCLIKLLIRKDSCAYCRQSINSTLDEYSVKNPRCQMTTIKEKISQLLRDESKRILVCSYYKENFITLEAFMNEEKKSFSYVKGTSNMITKIVNSYNSGEIKVLFLNAKHNAAGLNLNLTTDIIFMNNIYDGDKMQLIGRAQRPIRHSPLTVHECKPIFNFY